MDKEAIEAARTICDEILAGTREPLHGVRILLRLTRRIEPEGEMYEHEELLHIIGIESESDHLPFGDERALWSPKALAEADLEIARYGAQVLPEVRRICTWLKARYA